MRKPRPAPERRELLAVALALGAFGLASCTSAGASRAVEVPELELVFDRDAAELSDEAEAYVADAVAVMRREAIHRREIDFDVVHQTIRHYADGARTAEDTHEAIGRALPLLRDHHSSFLTFAQLEEYMGLTREDMDSIRAGRPPHVDPSRLDSLRGALGYASGRVISRDGEDPVGYLRVPEFENLTAEGMAFFADSLQRTIRQFDQVGVSGWIVDLRDNRGGAAMPMIAGLGPLLDGGNGYYTVDAGGDVLGRAYYRDGGYYDVPTGEAEGEPIMEFGVQYEVSDPAARVAVLTDNRTASSAEAVTAVFAGQPNVQIIGQRTNGLTSTNSFEVLSDGAVLNLTIGHYADRDRTVYEQGISPNIEVPVSAESDDVIERALSWIAS